MTPREYLESLMEHASGCPARPLAGVAYVGRCNCPYREVLARWEEMERETEALKHDIDRLQAINTELLNDER